MQHCLPSSCSEEARNAWCIVGSLMKQWKLDSSGGSWEKMLPTNKMFWVKLLLKLVHDWLIKPMLKKHVPPFLQNNTFKNLFLIYHKHHSVYKLVFQGPEALYPISHESKESLWQWNKRNRKVPLTFSVSCSLILWFISFQQFWKLCPVLRFWMV